VRTTAGDSTRTDAGPVRMRRSVWGRRGEVARNSHNVNSPGNSHNVNSPGNSHNVNSPGNSHNRTSHGARANSLYSCELSHIRTAPIQHAFTYRMYLWLVDLDRMPSLPVWLRPLARFEAKDHLGDPARTIRANVDGLLAQHGVDLTGGTVLMLTHARVFGYVFNPLTLFWSRYQDGSLACVIVEVHNTYGGRHCYLLATDERDRAQTDKQLYVSPVYPVDGEYHMYLPEPNERLRVTISLHREGQPPFVATLRGDRQRFTNGGLLRAALRHPLSTAAVSARIRRHGIYLYLRGLPVQPRPRSHHREAVR
jgi:DUF1365 family protein